MTAPLATAFMNRRVAHTLSCIPIPNGVRWLICCKCNAIAPLTQTLVDFRHFSILSVSVMDRASWRTLVLSNHLLQHQSSSTLTPNPCLQFSPPELSECFSFDIKQMRNLLDAHNLPDRDWVFGLMVQSKLFNPVQSAGRVFVSPDYNQSMEQQREMTMKRIQYLLDNGVFRGWLTDNGIEDAWRKFAVFEAIGIYDHSLAIKLGVHIFLWYVAIYVIRVGLNMFFILAKISRSLFNALSNPNSSSCPIMSYWLPFSLVLKFIVLLKFIAATLSSHVFHLQGWSYTILWHKASS